MTKSTTRGFFFAGTFFFVTLFILLTIHTHTTIAARTHEEGLTETVRHGKHVWGKYNCENCHTLLGEGRLLRSRPDADRLATRACLSDAVPRRPVEVLFRGSRRPANAHTRSLPRRDRGRGRVPRLGGAHRHQRLAAAADPRLGRVESRACPAWPGWPPRTSHRAVARRSSTAQGSARPATRRSRAWCWSVHRSPAIGKHADERIHDPQYKGSAKTATDYLEESILKPSAFIVPGDKYRPRAGTVAHAGHLRKGVEARAGEGPGRLLEDPAVTQGATLPMTYESQRIAYAYFFSAILLFGLQVVFGFL